MPSAPPPLPPSISAQPSVRRTTSGRSENRSTGDFEPVAPLAIAPYLETFGFSATDAEAWNFKPGEEPARHGGGGGRRRPAAPPPRLHLEVCGHQEIAGKTQYTVSCALVSAAARSEWSVQRRLAELREDLHNSVKRLMGDAYSALFVATPFASYLGMPGTTARLDAWCRTLANVINAGSVHPSVVALVLYFFEAPLPEAPSNLELSLHTSGKIRGQAVQPSLQGSPPPSRTASKEESATPAEQEEFTMDDIVLSMEDAGLGSGAGGGSTGGRRGSESSDGLLLRFRLPSGAERLFDFASHKPPLGLDFQKSVPLLVINAYGLAERMGVRANWHLVGINGTCVVDWAPVEAFKLMKAIVSGRDATRALEAGRPAPARRMDVVFRLPDGSDREVCFTGERAPLGLVFRRKVPVTVRQISPGTAAERLGVQEDWIVAAVNGEDVMVGTFDQIYKKLHRFLHAKGDVWYPSFLYKLEA